MITFLVKLISFCALLSTVKGEYETTTENHDYEDSVPFPTEPALSLDEIETSVRLNATQGQFPYQIILRPPLENDNIFCRGALAKVNGIQVVITTAYCVELSKPLDSYTLVAGEWDLNETSGLEQKRKIGNVYIHPDYTPVDNGYTKEYKNNIALLIPEVPFKLNDNVQPVALPKRGHNLQGNITVTGWSRTTWYGGIARFWITHRILNYANMPIVKKTICQEAYEEQTSDPLELEKQFCAGIEEVASCNSGNVGDPAVSEDGYLVGIASILSCPLFELPRVYTQVSEFIDWMEASTKDYNNHRTP